MFEVLFKQADGNILSTAVVVEFVNVIPDDTCCISIQHFKLHI